MKKGHKEMSLLFSELKTDKLCMNVDLSLQEYHARNTNEWVISLMFRVASDWQQSFIPREQSS